MRESAIPAPRLRHRPQGLAAHRLPYAQVQGVILDGFPGVFTHRRFGEERRQLIEGEERFPNVGVTDTGRWLVVVLTERGTKARVVAAFEADKDLIAFFIREKWGKQ